MISITSIYFGSLKGVLAVPFAASQHAVCFGSQISEATRAMLTPHRPGKLTAGQTPHIASFALSERLNRFSSQSFRPGVFCLCMMQR